jgi:hypothetical protein
LASIIKALQAEKFGKNNALISQFEINIKRDGTPSIIKYRASTGVNLDETELYQSFISMYLYDRQIPYKMQQVGKDGKLLMEEKSISTKELALELIRYNYLAGGVQGAIQFTRYIPVEVLMDLGFNKTLKNENFGYESLKLITDEFGNVIEGNVIEQIIQHNPKMLPIKIKTPFVVSESEAKKNGMRITESSEIDPNLSIVKKFRPYISTDSKKDEDNTGSRFITDAGFTPYTSVKIKDKWYLYKYDGEDGSYKLIPTLGVFGMSEYNYRLETGEVAKSAIDANNYFTDQHIVTKRPQMIGQNILEETNKNPIHELYDLNSYNKTSNPVETLLANIANNYDKDTDRRDYTARLAKKLLDNKFILDFSKHVRLKYETPQNGQT